MTAPRVAVVVPARDEAAVIARCLEGVLAQRGDLLIDVTVVAGACTDDTAERARALVPAFAARGHRLGVVELPAPGKPSALDAGDAVTTGDVRVYLDADAVLSPGALQALVEELATPRPRLAAPRLELELPARGLARQHGLVWRSLPPVPDGVVGAGCYAVNRAGRRRWESFPALVADDGYVRSRFDDGERAVVAHESFTVPYPSSAEIVGVAARWRAGNRELAARASRARDRHLLARRLATVLRSPRLWPALPGWALVTVRARLAARRLADRVVAGGEWPRAARPGPAATRPPAGGATD